MSQVLSGWFSVWDTTRALALTSYLLLFISVVAGIFQSLKVMPPSSRANLAIMHTLCGWLGFLFGLTHGLVLLFDTFVGYTITEILVPFTAKKNPVEIGLGVLSLYMVFLLVISSDLLKNLGKKVWRSIHFLAFPAFLLALYHGVSIGTDTAVPGIKLLYVISGSVVAFLVVIRILVSSNKAPATNHPNNNQINQ